MEILLLLAGAALLYLGGDLLVRGAVNISRMYGLSPLVIGLTVVAFGTSTPELASSLIAASRGAGDIAFGNVIGSNIANIGLILGAAALVYPLASGAGFLTREIPILVLVSALLPIVAADGAVSRLEGVGLCIALVPYLWILTRKGEAPEIAAEFSREYGQQPSTPATPVALVAAGIVLLVAGAAALIEGAVDIARTLGVSERVIGITLVAFGTSLPELATSVVAALRKEGDIALGNVVGSNVFNVLAVLGATAVAVPFRIDVESLWNDIGVMLLFTLALIPIAFTHRRVGRLEGAALVAGYATYVAILFSNG